MSDAAFNIADYVDENPDVSEDAMARLSKLAQDQLDAIALVESLEQQLKDAKASLRAISEHRLPDLMDELELEEFKTKNGTEIKVGEAIRGSIPEDNKEKAFAYLEETNNGKIIKNQFVIEFGKGDEAWAKKFQRDLNRRKKKLNTKVKKSVHPQTLYGFVREQLEAGVDFPMDLFGVFRQRFAKVKITD